MYPVCMDIQDVSYIMDYEEAVTKPAAIHPLVDPTFRTNEALVPDGHHQPELLYRPKEEYYGVGSYQIRTLGANQVLRLL